MLTVAILILMCHYYSYRQTLVLNKKVYDAGANFLYSYAAKNIYQRFQQVEKQIMTDRIEKQWDCVTFIL